MFGLFRCLLATAVVASHLLGVGTLGWLAVQAFFILSGYLMTTIMHRTYGYGRRGVQRFAVNRALRLLPVNICIVLMAAIIVAVAGEDLASRFQNRMGLPESVGDWLANLTMIYPTLFPASFSPQLSSPSWTITIELVFYALIALGLSRTAQRTWVWLVVAIAYLIIVHALGLDVTWRYDMIAAGALPFAMGALIYHYKDTLHARMSWLASSTLLIWLTIAFALNALFNLLGAEDTQSWLFNITFYLNLFISAGLVLALDRRRPATPRRKRLDHLAGEFSYPLYLLHMPVAFALSVFVFDRAERVVDAQAPLLFGLTLLVSALISLPLIFAVDRPIQRLRDRVRPRLAP